MKVVKPRIILIDGYFQYAAEAIEENGRHYYRVEDTTVGITKSEYDRVIGNPCLYYFSTALRLHNLIRGHKDAAP
jgi:hypothetical protein